MESVTLELRPRLRSLSAYISLIKNIDTSMIKVKLLEDAIEIEIEDKVYTLPLSSVKLLPSSLSSLGITSRWISFRIQTQPNYLFGTFTTEIINLENQLGNFSISSTNDAALPPKNTDCKLICTCCKNQITKTVNFIRILPLPSSDCDPQEWYCCSHDGHDDKISLDPGETDLFYSSNYCVLNKHVFEENLKIKNSLIHCNRCLSIIGLSRKKELKSLQIWNCCIEYKILDGDQVIKGSSSSLSDFLAAVKSTADLIIGEQILLEAQDDSNVHYILLRPMESKLNLLTEDKSSPKEQKINLESSFVVKVLYKYGISQKTIKSNDPDLKYCELSLPSIQAGMDELVSSSARFPPAYRKTDDFYISYLPL